MRIRTQNLLFEAFLDILEGVVEGAIAGGSYDVGLEVLTAESFRIEDRQVAYTHPGTRAQTLLLTVAERRRVEFMTLPEALSFAREAGFTPVVNSKT